MSILAMIAVAAWLPGLLLRESTPAISRLRRLNSALVLGLGVGWWLGSSTLATELPPPLCVPPLLISTGILAEGIAGRGWPWAGFLSSLAYLASLLRDLLDRTGETAGPVVWIVLAVVSVALGWGEQGVWRLIWRRFRPVGSPSQEGAGN